MTEGNGKWQSRRDSRVVSHAPDGLLKVVVGVLLAFAGASLWVLWAEPLPERFFASLTAASLPMAVGASGLALLYFGC